MTYRSAAPAKLTYKPRNITWNRVGSSPLLNKCLANEKVRQLFGKFQETEVNLEGLLFLEDCALFFGEPTLETFRALAANFVLEKAQHQVNVSAATVAAFRNVVTLDEAQAAVTAAEIEIHRLVSSDPLKRFVNSATFQAFLAGPEGAELFPELQT